MGGSDKYSGSSLIWPLDLPTSRDQNFFSDALKPQKTECEGRASGSKRKGPQLEPEMRSEGLLRKSKRAMKTGCHVPRQPDPF